MTQLSILIPVYNYPNGIDNILFALTPVPTEVELIISDDSTDDEVKRVVHKYASQNIIYQRNNPAKGAVANWQYLLDSAQGEFVLLLHHDELPLGRGFLDRILNTLRHTSSDVLIMDVLMLDVSLVPIRGHVPRVLRDLVIRYVPGYLFCRNIIGPTAALVVRKAAYPKFDTSLNWLVDVDMYYRLCKNTKYWQTIRGIEIGSVQGDHATITQTLQSSLKQVEQTERSRLSAKYPEASFWINLQQKPLIGALEAAFWGGGRAIQIVLLMVKKPKRQSK